MLNPQVHKLLLQEFKNCELIIRSVGVTITVEGEQRVFVVTQLATIYPNTECNCGRKQFIQFDFKSEIQFHEILTCVITRV